MPTVHALTSLPDDEPVADATFSRDGRFLAIGTYWNRIYVWAVGGEEAARPVHVLEGHQGTVHAIDFSPDGRHLASASSDGSVRFWDLDGAGERPVGAVVVTGLESAPTFLRFGADGRTLVTGESPATVRVWSLDGDRVTGQPIVMNGGSAYLTRLWLTDDERWIVGGGTQGAPLAVWPRAVAALVERACRVAGRNLRGDEWLLHRPGEPYRRTCPQYPAADEFELVER